MRFFAPSRQALRWRQLFLVGLVIQQHITRRKRPRLDQFQIDLIVFSSVLPFARRTSTLLTAALSFLPLPIGEREALSTEGALERTN